MYTGHVGVALASKGRWERLPLWLLALAAVGPDVADPLLRLSGAGLPSHTLGAVLAWSLLFAATARAIGTSWTGAAVAGGVALSHLPLDWLTSRLPLWVGGPAVGLHLYRYDPVDFGLEAGLVVGGWLLYRRTVPDAPAGRAASVAILVLLLGLQVYFQSLPVT